ncbi:MAG: filamentous hemagglutinin N-terminal domain-containing protein, partial [Myxococcales bacterium]|nr:filamentous hemagglutinin N-terminal domain-containing protein [Myxococcales bacterium]
MLNMLKTLTRTGRIRECLSLWLALALAVQPLLTAAAMASPEGAQVVHGDVSFSNQGDLTVIHASDRSIIDYTGFDIAGHETVQFIQPSDMARVLNRIQSALPTQIDGALLANGQVYIVNPAGVFFGEGAVVDVGRLVAAAANISNEDFLQGLDRFTRVDGSVENRGIIDAGVAQLIGRRVANHGVIRADDIIVLAAGDEVFLGEVGGSSFVKVSASALAAGDAPGVLQAGDLDAGDGHVTMAAGDLYSLAIDHTGRTRAANITLEGGDGGVVQVAGTLDASDRSAGGVGGDVTITGDRIAVGDAAIDASGDAGGGRVRIGGDFQGQGDLPTASRTVVSADATIRADAETDGDGGTVIVWADDATGFAGEISARGGAASGDGGFAEVSGRDQLVYRGHADLSAANGETGTLLLDPETIVIQGGVTNVAGAGTDADLPTIGADDAPAGAGSITTVTEEGIETQVAHVVLEAGQSIETQGTFDFGADADGVVTLGTNLNLTLQTRNNTATDGAGGIDLTGSDHGADLEFATQGTGAILIEGGTAGEEAGSVTVGKLTTADQQITLNSNTLVAVENTLASGSGNVTIGAPSAALSGDIDSTGTISGTASSVSVDPGAEIQDGIDIVDVTGGTVNVGAGTYVEDLSIDKDNLELAGAGVGSSIVQGVANVDAASFPLAVPNIDVQGDGVRIHDFTLRGPDPVAGRYASGMVIGGNDVEIDGNAFEVTNAATFDDISQGIQTYRDANNPRPGNDLSGLSIHDNTFAAHGAAPGPTEAGYEGIFLNHTTGDPASLGDASPGLVTIADNSFSGPVLRGITTERSNVAITGNTIETTLTPSDGGAVAGNAFQGILVQDFSGRAQQDVTVTGNTVGGDVLGHGFSQGIRVGAAGQPMAGIDVSGNTLNFNDLQVQDRAGVLTIADVFASNSFDRSVIVEGGDTVFSKVQDGIDVAPAGVDAANPTGISVGNGTYVEDLAITTNNLDLAGAGAGSTTIQGVATSSQASFPLVAPNIDIRADGVAVHGFTIASPDLSPVGGVDQRSDGIVLKGTGIEIYDNTFQMNQSVADVAVEAGGNTSVAIQTWRDSTPDAVASNLNGLNIHDNTFQGTPSDGYYGVLVKQQGAPVSAADADAVKIADNTFTGTIWRAISTERSNTDITGNTITTDTATGVFGSNSG